MEARRASTNMSLAESLLASARACEGAATALAHLLRSDAKKSNASVDFVATFQEAQAFAITVRAVLDEAQPILPLLGPNDHCVGKNAITTSSPLDVCNGFDAIVVILINLLDISNEAILSVAAIYSRWLVSPLQATGCYDRMVTHHSQLRGMYGILHLSGKIANHLANPFKSIFANVSDNDPETDIPPSKWRSAIKLDDFYGRHFGFHYTPEMRNVLRIVNIVRGSVHRSHNTDGTPQVLKNVAMLGWGWIYSNMVIMNNLGVSIDGVTQIGADSQDNVMTIERLRKFMNMVEEPMVTSVGGLTSADVAVNDSFAIPPPNAPGGLESSDASDDALREVLDAITGPVQARVMSFKGRPLDLPSGRNERMRPAPETPSPSNSTRDNVQRSKQRKIQQTIVVPPGDNSKMGPGVKLTQETTAVAETDGVSAKVEAVSKQKATPLIQGPGGAMSAVVDNSFLATTISKEFRKLQTNVSSFLGMDQKKPARTLIVYFHGGGFVSQSSEAHSVYLREWCSDVPEAVLFSVDYKLAPEHPYPTAVHECLYAYVWALQNASRIGTLAERVVIAGDSAGGNLAVAVALKVNELGIRPADGICIAYPSLLVTMAWSPSRLLSFFDPLMPLSVLELCQKSYIPEGADGAKDPIISPLLASDDELRKLPPFSVICGSLDPLLDDTAEFAQRMHDIRDGDVFRVCQKLPHGFLNMTPVNELAREEMRFLTRSIAKYLNVPFRNFMADENTSELKQKPDETSNPTRPPPPAL